MTLLFSTSAHFSLSSLLEHKIEYTVLDLNHETKEARLSLSAWDTLMQLQKLETEAIAKGDKSFNMSWKPEYAIYMMEGKENPVEFLLCAS